MCSELIHRELNAEAVLATLAFTHFLGSQEGAGLGGHLDGGSGKKLLEGEDSQAGIGLLPELGFVEAGAGGAMPSPDDVAVTRAMVSAGKILDFNVLDHIVCGRNPTRFVSLKERGLGFS